MAQIQMLQENFVGPGERKTYDVLRSQLPAAWLGVASKEIVVSAEYSREADFIVVGQSTIFVIEEKSWSGRIDGDDSWWFVRGTPRTSPLNQVEGVAKTLAGQMKDTFPAFRNEGRLVVGVVILSSGDVTINFNENEHRRDRVLFLHEAADRLIELDSDRRNPFVSVSRDSVAKRLGRLQTRQVPKEIGSYRIEETLPTTGIFRNWRATQVHTGEERLLRAVTVKGFRTEQERTTLLEPILREYAVYNRVLAPLASEGRVPSSSDPIPFKDDFLVFPIRPPKGRPIIGDAHASPSTEEAVAYAKSAFDLLARVHNSGVIHRNISPQKLLMTPDGSAALIDFLIARITGSQTVAASAWLTDDISVFTAPELRDGVADATQAADVYGLAASIIFWMERLLPQAIVVQGPRTGGTDEVRDLLITELGRGLLADPEMRPTARALADSL